MNGIPAYMFIPRYKATIEICCKRKGCIAGVPANAHGVLHLRGAEGHQKTGDSAALQSAAVGLCCRGAEGLQPVESGRGAAEGLQVF